MTDINLPTVGYRNTSTYVRPCFVCLFVCLFLSTDVMCVMFILASAELIFIETKNYQGTSG